MNIYIYIYNTDLILGIIFALITHPILLLKPLNYIKHKDDVYKHELIEHKEKERERERER